MQSSARRALLVVTAGIAVVVIVVFSFRRDIAIAFHRRAMVALFAATSTNGHGRQSDNLESFEYHRDCLASLGYFEQRVFPLRHVRPRTPEWKTLFNDLNAVHTNIADGWFLMRGYEATSPTQVIVWTRPEFVSKYEQIVAARDR